MTQCYLGFWKELLKGFQTICFNSPFVTYGPQLQLWAYFFKRSVTGAGSHLATQWWIEWQQCLKARARGFLPVKGNSNELPCGPRPLRVYLSFAPGGDLSWKMVGNHIFREPFITTTFVQLQRAPSPRQPPGTENPGRRVWTKVRLQLIPQGEHTGPSPRSRSMKRNRNLSGETQLWEDLFLGLILLFFF